MPFLARSEMDRSVMSSPSSRIWPLVARSTPMMSLASVDLPPPFGPVITVKRPSGMVSDRSSMMRFVSFDPSASGTSKVRFLSSSITAALPYSSRLFDTVLLSLLRRSVKRGGMLGDRRVPPRPSTAGTTPGSNRFARTRFQPLILAQARGRVLRKYDFQGLPGKGRRASIRQGFGWR